MEQDKDSQGRSKFFHLTQFRRFAVNEFLMMSLRSGSYLVRLTPLLLLLGLCAREGEGLIPVCLASCHPGTALTSCLPHSLHSDNSVHISASLCTYCVSSMVCGYRSEADALWSQE
jgi:hypothetical protein